MEIALFESFQQFGETCPRRAPAVMSRERPKAGKKTSCNRHVQRCRLEVQYPLAGSKCKDLVWFGQISAVKQHSTRKTSCDESLSLLALTKHREMKSPIKAVTVQLCPFDAELLHAPDRCEHFDLC